MNGVNRLIVNCVIWAQRGVFDEQRSSINRNPVVFGRSIIISPSFVKGIQVPQLGESSPNCNYLSMTVGGAI